MWLIASLVVDGTAGIWLATEDLDYISSVYDFAEAGVLFAIGLTNLLAAVLVLRRKENWEPAAFIAQVFSLTVAIYAARYTAESPEPSCRVLSIAVSLGIIATFGLAILASRAIQKLKPYLTTAVVVSAAVPLLGYVHLYVQEYYTPHKSDPLVDVTVQLTSHSRTKSTIQLYATVTMHNRRSVRVSVPAALMRITAFPPAAPPSTKVSDPGLTATGQCTDQTSSAERCGLDAGLNLAGSRPDSSYRAEPLSTQRVRLLYAELVMAGSASELLSGETRTFQREVDIDPTQVRLARLSVGAVFAAQRKFQRTSSCVQPAATLGGGDTPPLAEINRPFTYSIQTAVPASRQRATAQAECVDYEFAPQNVFQHIIGNVGALRVNLMLSDPQTPPDEVPRLRSDLVIVKPDGSGIASDERTEQRLSRRNPLAPSIEVHAEYAPGDEPATEPEK